MINQLIPGNIILRINEKEWIATVSDRERERNPLEKYIKRYRPQVTEAIFGGKITPS